MSLLLALLLQAAPAALASGPAGRTNIDLENRRYSKGTRGAFEQLVKTVYLDVEARPIRYAALNRSTIASIDVELRARHPDLIATFVNAFVRDETKSGRSVQAARQRADAFVERAFDDIWDVEIDLHRDDPSGNQNASD